MPDYLSLNHQAVRDLYWCCNAPSLHIPPHLNHLKPKAFQLPVDPDWFYALDTQPDSLLDHLDQYKTQRLGLYFEALWLFIIQSHPNCRLISHNHQIHNPDGRTIGAFDFLIEYNGSPFHLETTVKYYLQHTTTTAENWLGPNCNDSLDKKLKRLSSHQLPLSQHPAATEYLKTLGIELSELKQQAIYKGYLFYNAKLNPDATKHQWMTVSEFLNLTGKKNTHRWKVLPKSLWLSPAISTPDTLIDLSELSQKLQAYFQQQKRPLLLAAFNDSSQTTKQELTRFFITPDHWPFTTTP